MKTLLSCLLLLGTAAMAGADDDRITRGEYLVTISGCGDCHTPMVMGPEGPQPDESRFLSGHPAEVVLPDPPAPGDSPWVWFGAATNTAFAGPWGVSFSSNLTPDPDTGIGRWTEKMFVDTLRTGLHWGSGRPIMPPMPWPAYARATDEDLAAIFAYLRSVPAISNPVPAPRPAPAPVH